MNKGSLHYRRLGRTGLKVSEISLGAWVTFGEQISDEAAHQLTCAAFEAGVNFFDNADVYADGRAEEVLGLGTYIKRSPLCGRNFEYFSEDPCLSGQLAAAYSRPSSAAR